ncbi:MAG: erythromycin esterase family protein [Pseudomonadota bacterium]|nr:erythromycin esterase family protein [Pseudomonadota bacterium]
MKISLKLLLVLLCIWIEGLPAVAATPVPVAAANLAFDKWDNGAPVGWVANAPGFKASSDCAAGPAGRCVLRLESSAATGRGALFPVAQRIGLGDAAGHQLTLSGLIRTNEAAGRAALWLRADAQSGPSLAFDNMAKRAPTGTTGWNRFSVSIPVPRNAAGIVLGVMLIGPGTAWFDELQLTADPSVDVADAVAPTVTVTARPAPSQALLSDAALRIAPADIADVSAAWRADVASRVHPIRSLYSDDFSDLQFLKPLLAGKRVVQLGESGHGVGEFSLAKVRLIKFLHQQMGYDVVAFESSLPQCYLANQAIGQVVPIEVMHRCLFGVWRSSEALALFDYLDVTRKSGKRLTLAGFDTQDSSNSDGAPALLTRMLELAGWARAAELPLNEIALFKHTPAVPLAPELAARLAAFYNDAAAELVKQRARVLKAGAVPEQLEVAIQSATSRARLAGQFGAAFAAGSALRDLGMADNLDFLLDRLYPGRKVIVWAHNAHVTYQRPTNATQSMGAFVAQRRKAEVYTIGLFMGRGAATLNNRVKYQIAAPAAGTFDAVMTNAGARYAFVDFSTAMPAAETDWMFAPIVMREWGTNATTVTPASAYDGVLFIDTVTPPDYL